MGPACPPDRAPGGVRQGRETLPDLARKVLTGELLLGAGISDVRSFPNRYIEATHADGGWIFSGTISWVSGWGLNSVLAVAAVETATETVVTALVQVGERTRVAAPLDLAAVAGSRTSALSSTTSSSPRST